MLKYNPQTGQMEDDGIPDPLLAMERAPSPAGIPDPGIPQVPLPPLAQEPQAASIPVQPEQQLPPPVAPVPTPPIPRPPSMPKPPGGLQGDLARVNAENEAAAKLKGAAEVGKANAAVDAQAEEIRVREEHAARQQVIQQQTDAEVARKQGELDDESKKYKSMSFKDFWSDKSTGARVLGAISIGLGAAGAALTGGQNTALAIIDKAIDRNYQMQRDAIMKQKDIVTEARMGVEGARQAKADKLLQLENWRKNAYEITEAKTKALMDKAGVPAAEANASGLLAGVHEKALESKMALDKGIAQVAEIKSATAKNYAEIGKIKADTGKEKDSAGRAAGHFADMAIYGTGVKDALHDATASGLSPAQMSAAMRKVQDNETSLKGVEDAHGVKGILGAKLGRATGLIPRSRLDGLTEQEQRFVNGLDIAAKKTATIIAGQGHANAHEMMESFKVGPNDSPKLIAQKLQEMNGFADKAIAASGKFGVTAEAAGAASRAGAAPGRQQATEAAAWLKANPTDPRAPAVRKKLAEMAAGGL